MEELQYCYFEVPNIKAWQIMQITQDWLYKVINHSFIENHSIETEKEKIPIVPWVLMLESLFDYFWLDLLNQPYEAEFNSFLKPEDIVNFYFSGNEYGIKKQKENIVKLKKLDKCEYPDFNFSQKTIKTHLENINHIENTGQLFQKDNFSLVNKITSYHLNSNTLWKNDIFLGTYNDIIDNPFLLIEFAAQSASLMASHFLKNKIITLKQVSFKFLNQIENKISPSVKWKVISIDKRTASIWFEIYQKWEKKTICYWQLKWDIISPKILTRLLKK